MDDADGRHDLDWVREVMRNENDTKLSIIYH